MAKKHKRAAQQADNSEDKSAPSKKRDDVIEVMGEITELLPGGTFRVLLDDSGQEIIAHLGGKLRMFKIRLSLGDRVKVEMTTYDLTKGRITYRY